jgi:hypothetical protein
MPRLPLWILLPNSLHITLTVLWCPFDSLMAAYRRVVAARYQKYQPHRLTPAQTALYRPQNVTTGHLARATVYRSYAVQKSLLTLGNSFAIVSNVERLNKSSASAPTSLIRTISGSLRPLDKDLKLTRLQAIDRVQRLHEKFQEYWLYPPWLVLPDGHFLVATMPVERMLAEIEKHGHPIGIVGPAQITMEQDSILVMHFRKDSRSRKTVEASAQEAKALVDEANLEAKRLARELAGQNIRELHRGQE